MSAEDLANEMGYSLEPETEAETQPDPAPAVDEPKSTGEEQSAPPAEDKSEHQPEPQMVPLAAKQAEKDRRQQAERERDYLKLELDKQVAQHKQGDQEQRKPDIFDDPEQYMQQFQAKIDGMVNEKLVNLTEEMARSQHDDYDEVMDHFETMIRDRPALYAEAMNKPSPAEAAYQTAKRDKEIGAITDVDAYKKQIKEQARQEVIEEMKAKGSSIPPDLTKMRSSSGVDQSAEGVIDFKQANLNDFL